MDTAQRLLVFADLALSLLWTCCRSLSAFLVDRSLGKGIQDGHLAVVLDNLLYLFSSCFFSWLGSAMRGGTNNPINVLWAAMSGDTTMFSRTFACRILTQVTGSIVGVGLVRELFTDLNLESCMNSDIHRGALTEGIISFAYVLLYSGTKKRYRDNFFLRVPIMGICKLTLRLLSGGCMNPATAIGWAFSRGDHATRVHLFDYWLAPFEATLLGYWVSSLLVEEAPSHDEEEKRKKKQS